MSWLITTSISSCLDRTDREIDRTDNLTNTTLQKIIQRQRQDNHKTRQGTAHTKQGSIIRISVWVWVKVRVRVRVTLRRTHCRWPIPNKYMTGHYKARQFTRQSQGKTITSLSGGEAVKAQGRMAKAR